MPRATQTVNEIDRPPGHAGGSVRPHRRPYDAPGIRRLKITCIADGLPSPPGPPYPFQPPGKRP